MGFIKPKISVAIIENNSNIASSLELLINDSEDFLCIGVFETVKQSLANLINLDPKLVLVDINLNDGSGIDVIKELKPKMKRTEFVILTMYEDTELVFEALKAGATGYLLKRTPPQKILESLMEVSQGGSPMSMEIARKVVNFFKKPSSPYEMKNDLTQREFDVLSLLAKGMRYKEIANNLNIGVETVRSHLRNIYEKLQVKNATQAILKYLNREIS
jgi:DNA-binding NarL/FixJ family response regulator